MQSNLLSAIRRLTSPLERRIVNLVQRAVLHTLDQNQGRVVVQLTGASGEPMEAELSQPFGLSSHPVKGGEAVVLAMGGDSSNSIALLVGDTRYRVDVAEGEVALYNQSGASVHLKQDKIIEINGDQININGPTTISDTLTVADDLTAQKSLSVNRTITAQQDATIAGISFIGHTHSVPGAGNSTPPI